MDDPLVGRSTDPNTSTEGIRKQVPRLKTQVLEAARALGRFNDTELTAQVERMTNRRQQRGTIARTRLNLELAGFVERQPELDNHQITFVVTPMAWTKVAA